MENILYSIFTPQKTKPEFVLTSNNLYIKYFNNKNKTKITNILSIKSTTPYI